MSTEEPPFEIGLDPRPPPLGPGRPPGDRRLDRRAGVFFRDAVFLGKSLFYFDITEINYPYRDFLANELKAGRFSRWHPGINNGLPLFAESQAGYLHPLKYLLYPWMATWRAFNLDTILSVWLTGLATYGWLRRHVGPAGALTGAALFGLSGFVWAHLIHTSMTNALISVPLAFWGLEVAWDGGRLRGVALGALALACQVFAGHLQDTILTGGRPGDLRPLPGGTAGEPAGGLKALGFVGAPGGAGRGGLGRPVGPLEGPARPIPARRGPDLGADHLWLVGPRAPADAGRPRGLRDPRPRHRLARRLLPLSRDERLSRPDRHGPGRRRRGGLPRSLGGLVDRPGGGGRSSCSADTPPVRLHEPGAGGGQLADPGALSPLGLAGGRRAGGGGGGPAVEAGPGPARVGGGVRRRRWWRPRSRSRSRSTGRPGPTPGDGPRPSTRSISAGSAASWPWASAGRSRWGWRPGGWWRGRRGAVAPGAADG